MLCYFLIGFFTLRTLLLLHFGQERSIGIFLSYGPVNSCPQRKHLKSTISGIINISIFMQVR